jgi:hypothetical protein
MAKSAKVESVDSMVSRLVKASSEARQKLDTVRAESEVNIEKAGSAQLFAIAEVAKSLPQMTSKLWKDQFKAKAEAAFRAQKLPNGEPQYKEGSIFSVTSQHLAAIIGLQQPDMAPKAGSSRLSTYATYVREHIEGRKAADGTLFYEPSNKGGRKAGEKVPGHTSNGKAVEVTAEGAWAKLGVTDKADQQVVGFLVSKHMDKLRVLYASLQKA